VEAYLVVQAQLERLEHQGDYSELHHQEYLGNPVHYSEERTISLTSQVLNKMVKMKKKVMMTMMMPILEKATTVQYPIIQMQSSMLCPPT
jgi:hypothetical protein